MSLIKVLGIDLAKLVFSIHDVDKQSQQEMSNTNSKLTKHNSIYYRIRVTP